MSTRCYPLYKHGAPRLRVFLPNFWMKVIKPTEEQVPNVVQFSCSMEMTKEDIKNYLEKIYEIPVVEVRTRIATGEFKRDFGKGYIIKEDDIKYAYVRLPRDHKFEFPNIFPESRAKEIESEKKSLDEAKQGYNTFLQRNSGRGSTPGWFGI